MKKILPLFFIFIFLSCSNTEKATKLYLDAVREFNDKNFDKSKNYLELALKEKSNFYQAHFLKAKILFLEKDFENANKIFKYLSNKKKENVDCKLWLMRSHYFLNELNEAKIILARLENQNSEDWRIFYWKAQVAKSQNDFESYFSNLNTAEEILKSSREVYNSLAIIWHELGFSDKSTSYYIKANSLIN